MIKNEKQAAAVQSRRHAAGKSGVAAAVRRWMKRANSSSRFPAHVTLGKHTD